MGRIKGVRVSGAVECKGQVLNKYIKKTRLFVIIINFYDKH